MIGLSENEMKSQIRYWTDWNIILPPFWNNLALPFAYAIWYLIILNQNSTFTATE